MIEFHNTIDIQSKDVEKFDIWGKSSNCRADDI